MGLMPDAQQSCNPRQSQRNDPSAVCKAALSTLKLIFLSENAKGDLGFSSCSEFISEFTVHRFLSLQEAHV
jgi:hypothetical protein